MEHMVETAAKKRRRRKPRKNPKRMALIAGISVLLLLICILIFSTDTYDDFLDSLAMRESSDDYAVVNRFGYLGRYQLGELALQDAGFLDANGGWTSLANSYGIASDEDFLASEEGQDAAVRLYHTKLCGYIRGYGLDQYVGSKYFDIEITKSGLLAACHLVGVKSMSKALASGEMVYDGNQTPASEYLELFSGYDISTVWKP